MDDFPCIEVCFSIEGKEFNIKDFTEKIGIIPSEIRDIHDWPEVIKNNPNIPDELRSRYIWSLSQKDAMCTQIESVINKIVFQLTGKEEIILNECKKYNLTTALTITIHGEKMNLPEISLPPSIVSFFGNLNATISFDMYVY